MKKNDWIGLGTSVAVHALLLFLFTFLTAAQPEPQQLGFVEVEFGPFAQGRPVQESRADRPEDDEPQAVEPEQPEPEAAPPEEARPVDLPDQPEEIVDEEIVSDPVAEAITPEVRDNEADVEQPDPEPETQPVRPLGSGSVDASAGDQTGADGESADEQRSAPYQIEGLNRDAIRTVMPDYREKVNATIEISITVDPRGRVVQVLPGRKGNPSLEQAAMDALQQWQFNPLPPNAPQERQTGIVTFHFRLE